MVENVVCNGHLAYHPQGAGVALASDPYAPEGNLVAMCPVAIVVAADKHLDYCSECAFTVNDLHDLGVFCSASIGRC